MKQFITAIFMLLVVASHAQTALPNGDFETWQTSGSYENPTPTTFWTTLNAIGSLNPAAISVTKTTDAASGTYAARIETKLVGTFLVAGLITTGTFDLLSQKLTQGQPFTDKPTHISGLYKYTSVNGDSFTIAIELSKWMNNQHTILASNFLKGNQSVVSYTSFDLPLDYSAFPAEAPDSITVTFTSSAGGANFQGAAGSTLFVDKVELGYDAVGIEDKNEPKWASISPNPAQNEVLIAMDKEIQSAEFVLKNEIGQIVEKQHILGESQRVSIANLPTGVYFYEIKSINGKSIQGKLVKLY